MAKHKLLIVEDERLAREGIRGAVERDDPDFEIVAEAENGERALALIRRTRPDVVITDISMPKMDGLELIEEAREEFPETVFIIVSGYNDFSYAQRAIRFGVQEYLLKPVLPEHIHAALAKAREGIESRDRLARGRVELEERLRSSLPLQRERFLAQLLRGTIDGDEIAESARVLALDFDGDFFAVALLKIRYTATEEGEANAGPEGQGDEAARRAVDGPTGTEPHRQEQGQTVIAELSGEVFTSRFSCFFVPVSDSLFALIVVARGLAEEKAFAYLGQSIRRVTAGAARCLGVSVHGAVGNLYRSPVELRRSFAEAEEALEFCFAREGGTVLHYADIADAAPSGGRRPGGLEEEFILSVKLCDRDQCSRLIEELERHYRGNAGADPRLIKMDLLEIFIHLFDRLGEVPEGGEELQRLRLSAYRELQEGDSLADVFARMERLSSRMMDAIERLRDNRLVSRVEKVKELVEAHLGDPDLFLDEVAARVFVSPNYLRGIFKQRTGESFVEYLTRRRMERAAELLRDPTIHVQDVAERVGYPNQRYFSVCFKKVNGCSPSEFRTLHTGGQGSEKIEHGA